MAIVLSHRHIRLTIDGNTIGGLADDDQPVVFPSIEMVDPKFGKDGNLYGTETGMLGGEVTIKLLPASPSVKLFLNWMAERHKGHRRSFNAQYGDDQLDFAVQMYGGLFKSCTAASTPGQTFEAVFVFEEIIPEYNSAKFGVSLSAPSGTANFLEDSLIQETFAEGLGTASGEVLQKVTGIEYD